MSPKATVITQSHPVAKDAVRNKPWRGILIRHFPIGGRRGQVILA